MKACKITQLWFSCRFPVALVFVSSRIQTEEQEQYQVYFGGKKMNHHMMAPKTSTWK